MRAADGFTGRVGAMGAMGTSENALTREWSRHEKSRRTASVCNALSSFMQTEDTDLGKGRDTTNKSIIHIVIINNFFQGVDYIEIIRFITNRRCVTKE